MAVRGTGALGEDEIYSSFIRTRSSMIFFIGHAVVGVLRDWGAAAAARDAARLGQAHETLASKAVRGGGLLGGLLRHALRCALTATERPRVVLYRVSTSFTRGPFIRQ